MKHTREQKRAQMLAAAEAAIEELLDWEEQANKPNLTVIEEEVLRVREGFGERLAEVVLADQDAKQPVTDPACPNCGEAMRYKGQKRVDTESRVGLLAIDRGHYYCAHCESGLFPPG